MCSCTDDISNINIIYCGHPEGMGLGTDFLIMDEHLEKIVNECTDTLIYNDEAQWLTIAVPPPVPPLELITIDNPFDFTPNNRHQRRKSVKKQRVKKKKL